MDRLDIIKDAVEYADEGVQLELFNQYCENNNLERLFWNDEDSINELLSGKTPWEILDTVDESEYNKNDTYAYFNGLGYLVSCDSVEDAVDYDTDYIAEAIEEGTIDSKDLELWDEEQAVEAFVDNYFEGFDREISAEEVLRVRGWVQEHVDGGITDLLREDWDDIAEFMEEDLNLPDEQ